MGRGRSIKFSWSSLTIYMYLTCGHEMSLNSAILKIVLYSIRKSRVSAPFWYHIYACRTIFNQVQKYTSIPPIFHTLFLEYWGCAGFSFCRFSLEQLLEIRKTSTSWQNNEVWISQSQRQDFIECIFANIRKSINFTFWLLYCHFLQTYLCNFRLISTCSRWALVLK